MSAYFAPPESDYEVLLPLFPSPFQEAVAKELLRRTNEQPTAPLPNWFKRLMDIAGIGQPTRKVNHLKRTSEAALSEEPNKKRQCIDQSQSGKGVEEEFDEVHRTAMDNLIDVTNYNTKGVDLIAYLNRLGQKLESDLKDSLSIHQSFKVWLSLTVKYDSVQPREQIIEQFHLTTESRVLMNEMMIEEIVDDLKKQILERNANFVRHRSGNVIKQILGAQLTLAEFHPLKEPGAQYLELPPGIRNKQCCINVQNKDDRCFGYALLSAMHPVPHGEHPQRAHHYENFFQQHGLDQIQYPVAPRDVPAIEDKLQICINIYTIIDEKGQSRHPLYTSNKQYEPEIDLLYWEVPDKSHPLNKRYAHYAWIKKFASFVAGISKHEHPLFFCKKCFQHFLRLEDLEVHLKLCSGANFSKHLFTMPPEGSKLQFKNIRNEQRLPLVVYADFEAILQPLENPKKKKGSNKYEEHIPCSVGFTVISPFVELQRPYKQHLGTDPTGWFIDQLILLQNQCLDFLKNDKRMVVTDEEQKAHDQASQCYLCKKPFDEQHFKLKKVRDHDHFTGSYRGAAHSRCNMQLQKTYKIPVFFHNFRGYDGHFIVRAMGRYPGFDIGVIGQGMEKYLVLNFGKHLSFKDSFQFLSSSLDALATSLLMGGKENFKHLREEFPGIAEEKFDLLLRKGVYPYEYMDSFNRFEETSLPSIEEFHNTLRNADCPTKEYEHAKKVWAAFDCKTLRDYHDLYLKVDVLILADVFESFRDVCQQVYGLDPAHYVSAPSLSWDAALKYTEVTLHLVHDKEMYKMIDSGMRGGVAMISKRYARANNPLLGEYYNPSKPISYIPYFDANNLYGYAMSQPLPTGDFRWVDPHQPQLTTDRLMRLDTDDEVGYILDVDLEYPKELHDLHKDYPLAPERLEIQPEWQSGKQQEIQRHYSQNRNIKSTKLAPNLFDKEHYVIHSTALKLYLQMGLRLKKIHRAIQFKQSKWLESYINLNSDRRKVAQTEFEKNFYKLMNNAIYGKTCENLKKRTDIRLLNDPKKAEKLIQKPNCKDIRRFSEELVGIELTKSKSVIDKPFYVGFSVLELSKCHMYDFHYNIMKTRYGNGVELLMTDTDSLLYQIFTKDLYADMVEMKHHFDLADYPKEHKCYDWTNNKTIGKMKDETHGDPILEFVGLRAKMYSYETYNSKKEVVDKFRAKGIDRGAQKQLTHSMFKEQIFNPTENYVTNHRIGSSNHHLHTIETRKRGLSSNDDKRFILEDGIHTKPYGHYAITSKVVKVPVGVPEDEIYDYQEAIQKGFITKRDAVNRLYKIAFGAPPETIFEDAMKLRKDVLGVISEEDEIAALEEDETLHENSSLKEDELLRILQPATPISSTSSILSSTPKPCIT